MRSVLPYFELTHSIENNYINEFKINNTQNKKEWEWKFIAIVVKLAMIVNGKDVKYIVLFVSTDVIPHLKG